MEWLDTKITIIRARLERIFKHANRIIDTGDPLRRFNDLMNKHYALDSYLMKLEDILRKLEGFEGDSESKTVSPMEYMSTVVEVIAIVLREELSIQVMHTAPATIIDIPCVIAPECCTFEYIGIIISSDTKTGVLATCVGYNKCFWFGELVDMPGKQRKVDGNTLDEMIKEILSRINALQSLGEENTNRSFDELLEDIKNSDF